MRLKTCYFVGLLLAGCSTTNYLGPVTPEAEWRASVPTAQEETVAEQQARSLCVYQAQSASSMSFGLVHSLVAGIGVGSACVDHYKRIGVIR